MKSSVKDPVCGMTIDSATATDSSEHGGQTYYFGCTGCKKTFDADPGRYVENDASGHASAHGKADPGSLG